MADYCMYIFSSNFRHNIVKVSARIATKISDVWRISRIVFQLAEKKITMIREENLLNFQKTL